MDLGALLICLAAVGFASLVIMVACDSFEEAADYLGRGFPPGIKGATINAIGSSLPELFTASILLFAYRDQDGFSAGIATCAGSAVFNSVLIPALCAFAVLTRGVTLPDGSTERVSAITVSNRTILRDGLFFIAAELLLIYFLRDSTMVWWMGGCLMAVYAVYFAYLMHELRTGRVVVDDDDDDDDGDEDCASDSSVLGSILRLEFNQLLFAGRALNKRRAWVVLSLATIAIGAACYLLAEAVVESAAIMGVPAYFTAVILAAAATSVPDTILSVKDALSGDYDDAVSNALGSNIFDITVALGLPLLVYGLVYGNIDLSSSLNAAANVQELRVALVLITGFVMAVFLIGGPIGRTKAIGLILIYVAWTGFIVWRAASPDPVLGSHVEAATIQGEIQHSSEVTVRQLHHETITIQYSQQFLAGG